MSQNIALPPARVPLVDADGRITREWTLWFLAMFERAGGVQGLSNQELAGEAAGAQDYNKLLARIGASEAAARGSSVSDAALNELQQRLSQLEALSRENSQNIQMLAMAEMQPPQAPQASTKPSSVFDSLTVRGDTNLCTTSGTAKVGGGVGGSTAKFQVAGAIDASGEIKAGGTLRAGAGAVIAGTISATGAISTPGSMSAGSNSTFGSSITVNNNVAAQLYLVAGLQVVGARRTGNPQTTAYAGQTMGAAYSQSQAQTTDNAIRALSQSFATLISSLRSHGLVGD